MRLISAEVLKIVRRRGLMAWSLILTVGAVLIAEIILVVLHAVNAAKHGPAGGVVNMSHYLDVLFGLGTIVAIMIGATAGSQDVTNGVFRDLVVTGRKRSTLFNVRIPGVLLVLLPILALGFVLAVGGAFVFAGGLEHPTASVILKYGEYGLASAFINVVLAVSLTAFASARVVIGVLIAWNVIVGPLLLHIGSLGSVRKGLDAAAIEHFAPGRFVTKQVTVSTATALVVLLGWTLVFTQAGRWWTSRRDA
jgi:ABC-type transport system involved in multi-copper enzyme maturation permease subunit